MLIGKERKVMLWDDLKHVLENGKWSDKKTIDEVLITMSNMESLVDKEK